MQNFEVSVWNATEITRFKYFQPKFAVKQVYMIDFHQIITSYKSRFDLDK